MVYAAQGSYGKAGPNVLRFRRWLGTPGCQAPWWCHGRNQRARNTVLGVWVGSDEDRPSISKEISFSTMAQTGPSVLPPWVGRAVCWSSPWVCVRLAQGRAAELARAWAALAVVRAAPGRPRSPTPFARVRRSPGHVQAMSRPWPCLGLRPAGRWGCPWTHGDAVASP